MQTITWPLIAEVLGSIRVSLHTTICHTPLWLQQAVVSLVSFCWNKKPEMVWEHPWFIDPDSAQLIITCISATLHGTYFRLSVTCICMRAVNLKGSRWWLSLSAVWCMTVDRGLTLSVVAFNLAVSSFYHPWAYLSFLHPSSFIQSIFVSRQNTSESKTQDLDWIQLSTRIEIGLLA